MAARSSRSAHPPGLDWQDSFHSLDERYRQLQRQLNEKDEELTRWKVAARRADAAPPPPPATPHGSQSRRPRTSLRSPPGTAASPGPAAPARRPSLTAPRASVSAAEAAARAGAAPRPSVPRDFSWPPPPGEPGGEAREDRSRWADARYAPPPPASRLYSEEARARASSASENVYVPIPSTAQPDATRAAAINEAAMWGPESMLPDPSLIWGAEGSVQNYVAASALYHANEEMRSRLTEATTTIQSQQQELSAMRSLVTNMQTKTEDTTQQMHHLVRERDLATQKLASAKLTNTDLEKALRGHVSEQEKICFGLETQITELRSRLVVGTDSNEQLSRDVRVLLNETREKSAEAMMLRSKLALTESSLSSQKHTNENLLVELKSLNHQLVDERKRLLSLSRDIQLSGLDQERIAALQDQLQRVKLERDDYEREHVRLMADFVHITEGALQQARDEVRTDLQDWREAAAHWEEVAQLLYKDIAERTQTHIRCREACEEAKAMRDTYNVQLNAARDELALCRAKLDVVWPGHTMDTKNLSADDIRNAFGKQHRVPFMRMVMRAGQRGKKRAAVAPGTSTVDQDGTVDSDKENTSTADAAAAGRGATDPEGGVDDDLDEDVDDVEALWALPTGTDGDATEQVRELHEANLILLAELAQLRTAHELMQSQVGLVAEQYKSERQQLVNETQSLGTREAASQRLLERQLDRVTFLEAQVQSLRGYPVESSTSLDALAPTENVLELFLGQLVSVAAPANPQLSELDSAASAVPGTALSSNALLFDRFFCSADFLLHEAVVTPSITGLNGFFDTTASFRIAMDALLLYYLQTRDLIVQLHRVRSDEETQLALQRDEEAARQTASPPHQQGQEGAGSEKSASGSHSTVDSAERTAARLYETVAEGRLNLLDLVLDEATRHSARPTYKGHVCLWTPQGQHLASLEFRVTARAAYTEDFRQLVAKAFADDDAAAAAGHRLAAARRANAVSHSSGGVGASDLARSAADRKHTRNRQAARDQLQAWLSSASSTASSTPRPPHRAPSAGRRGDTSGLQLYPTSQGAQALVRGWSSSAASYTSATSSVVEASTNASVGESRPAAPARSLSRARRAAAPAPPPTTGPATAPVAAVPPSLRHCPPQTAAPATTAHFTHVPAAQLSAMSAVQSIGIEVERVELPGAVGVSAPPPRLSCLYLLPAVHQDVRLLAPPTPHYTIEYANACNAFNIPSVSVLAELTREPLTFFLVDEDASSASSQAIYALAVCEWTNALAHVNASQTLRLPLLRRDTYEVVPGAALVVTLTASSSAAPQQPRASAASPPLAATAAPYEPDLLSSQPALLSSTSRFEAAGPQAPARGPSDASTANVAGTGGVFHAAPAPLPQPLPLPLPPQVPAPIAAAHSMEEAMMQLEWQRMH